MQTELLFIKTSTCKSNPDIEYLDETSDYKLRIKAKQRGVTVEALTQLCKRIESSVSYLTKENYGKVYAAGYLRTMLLQKKGTKREKLAINCFKLPRKNVIRLQRYTGLI